MRNGKFIIFFSLLLLYTFISFFKIHYIRGLARYDEADESCFYWTESAFHYRYAEMVAAGEAIPSVDRIVQHPEAIKPYENFTIFMEWVSGSLYRLLAPLIKSSFFKFLIYFNAFFSSLSVFAVYLLAREIWKNRWAALLSALFYILTPAAYGRLIIGSYLRESFSLPWIFFSLYFFIKDRSARKPLVYPALSGLCLFIALASWHFTQFYYTYFILALFIAFLFRRPRPPLAGNLAVLTAGAFTAGLAVPALRTKGFLLSWPMLLSSCLLIFHYLLDRTGRSGGRRWKLTRSGLLLIITAVLILSAGVLSRRYLAEYSHVFSVLKYKLLYLGIKPAAPGLLPYSARVMWTSNANTVPWNDLFYYLSSTLFIALIAMAAAAKDAGRRKSDFPEQLTLFLAAAFLASYILIVRLEVFAVFFLSLFVARFVAVNPLPSRWKLGLSLAGGKIAASIIALILLLIPIRQLTRLTLYEKIPPHAQRIDIVRWVGENTAPDESFLTVFPLGSTIATYARRPIILHSKFESGRLRHRVEEFTFSLYDTEDAFHRFCRKYRADYFIYQTDLLFNTDRESTRYLADQLELKKISVVYKFHFQPEELKNFRLVYQNNYYRIFQVRKEGDQRPAIVPFYHPSFDASLYLNRNVPEEYFDDRVAEEVNDSLLEASKLFQQGMEYWNRGEYEDSRVELEKAIRSNANLLMAHFYLGGALYRAGEYSRGIERFKTAARLDPAYPEAFSYLGMGYESLGEGEEAIRAYRRAFELNPANPRYRDDLERAELEAALQPPPRLPVSFQLGEEEIVVDPSDGGAYNRLGVLHWRSGRYRRAIVHFEKAIELDPKLAIAYFNLGANYEELGEGEKAKDYYRRALLLEPALSAARKKLGLPNFPPPTPLKSTAAEGRRAAAREYSRRAELLIESGSYLEAVDLYREVVRLQPGWGEARNNLGGALYKLNRVDEAIVQYNFALRINPEDALARNNLGVALAARGDLEGALAEYERAIDIDPEYAEAYNNRGNALFLKEELEEAAVSYRRALQLNPESFQARNNLGLVFFRQGRLELAIEQFAEALRLKPDFENALLNLESALEQEKMREQDD